jgi:hypothetical protein
MIAMLRYLGHDCLDASAILARMPDVDVLRMAADHEGVVVTSDKDKSCRGDRWPRVRTP